MSNCNESIDLSIAIVIKKIEKAQSEVATYTTILAQLYRAKEVDNNFASEPLASDPIESFETIEFDEAQSFVSEEYRRYLQVQNENQQEIEKRERLENATRIQILSSRLEELKAIEATAKLRKEEGEKKPSANAYRPPGWKVPVGKAERFRQARHQAQEWAEQRKPNSNVWCSPANQKAVKERKAKVFRQNQLDIRQAQHASSKRSAAQSKASARAKQLDAIIEDFQRVQQRQEAPSTPEETARLAAIDIAPHPSFDSASGEGDY